MTDIYIFDKDGTLTQPLGDTTFVQHCTDQKLRLGVEAKLKELRGSGAMMAIASNQGGCAINEIPVKEARSGAYLHRNGLIRRITAVKIVANDGPVYLTLNDGDEYPYLRDEDVDISYKTIGSAVREMQFAMKLTRIEYSMMAHSYEKYGPEAYFVEPEYCRLIETPGGADFRKPSGGMLTFLAGNATTRFSLTAGRKVFVGDRPEDQGAALAAGFEFVWANDFFGGSHD